MKYPLLSLILLGLTLSTLAQRSHRAADPFSGLDTAIARVLKDWHAVGVAVAVVQKDKVIYSSGFGYRDWENKLPVTPHTLFAIGSCTKAFTSSLIGLLDSQGQLDIDKPVRNYFPELKFNNPSMDDAITLRDMMCHRTGLPRHDYAWYLFASGSRDSLISRIQYMEPTAGIREKWQYNNFMFLAQGMVVQKLTGNSWEKNISEKLFKPLGMVESNVSVDELQKSREPALGYGLKKDSVIQKMDYHDLHAIAPAGAINSNVTDMAVWVSTWINGGKYQDKQILPAAYVNEAMSAQMVSAGGVPAKESPDIFFSSYGFGWMLASYRGHYRVEHGGNIDGFSASTCFFPTDSVGIVVLSNQNGSQVPSIIRNLIADRLLHLPYKDWNTWLKNISDKGRAALKQAASSKISERKANTHPSHALNDYAGMYSNPGYGSFEVVVQKDSLFASLPLQTWWLKHYHYDIFDPFEKDPRTGIDTTDNGPLKVQFNMNQAGDIASIAMNLEPSLQKPLIFTRSAKVQTDSSLNMQKYVGEYLIATVTTKVYVKGKTLFLFVPGQPEYELLPIGKDKFALKTLSGYEAQFIVDDKGEVTALLAIQPNGTFKATKKK